MLLRPRSGVIEPAPVRTESYFSAAQLERARDYRRPQLALYGGVLVVELGLLALLVGAPAGGACAGPSGARCWPARPPARRSRVAVSVAILPLQVVSRERAKDVGLVTQSWDGYARDKSISWGIGAVIAGLGAATAVGLIRRYPRGWWMPGLGDRRRVRRREHLRRTGRARPDLQQVPGAARRADARRRARARRARRRRHRRGLQRRREPALDRGQRLRRRAGQHEARRALRHAAGELRARRGAPRRRARARAPALPRRAQRAAVRRDRRARSGCSRSRS